MKKAAQMKILGPYTDGLEQYPKITKGNPGVLEITQLSVTLSESSTGALDRTF